MNKQKYLFPALTSIISGLLIAAGVMAFTGPGSNQPPAGTPAFWQVSGSNVYFNSGNVGIGTTTPTTAKLVVNGTIAASSPVNDSDVTTKAWVTANAGGAEAIKVYKNDNSTVLGTFLNSPAPYNCSSTSYIDGTGAVVTLTAADCATYSCTTYLMYEGYDCAGTPYWYSSGSDYLKDYAGNLREAYGSAYALDANSYMDSACQCHSPNTDSYSVRSTRSVTPRCSSTGAGACKIK